jgi:Rod binding domain-containing protein
MPSNAMPTNATNVSLSTSLSRTPTAYPATAKAVLKNEAAAKDARKNEKAACDFEAMLLAPVFDSLQKTFAGDDDQKTPGADDYRQMGTQALAKAIAERGGIGIAQMILRHLQAPRVSGGS